MAHPPPFGLILPPRPIITNPLTISPTQYAFKLPSSPAFTHIVVFFVPGTVLPPNTLAAVYIQSPTTAAEDEGAGFRLLGAVGNERQTAIFQVNNDDAVTNNNGVQDDGDGDEMTDAEPTAAVVNGQVPASADPIAQFTIGISVEPTAAVEAQLAALKTSSSSSSTSSSALVRSPPAQQRASQGIPTKVLAQRIIKNAFNFLASFAGGGGGGEEMVPLRSFRGWWEKFERRVEMDPGFLERESDA
ncbi:MAG: hypothetical protein L6R37_002009 [Teloschistes peruensis]|nr:MAG: hypothetical protein L6R37_002009 [Teloschistes peruensis]